MENDETTIQSSLELNGLGFPKITWRFSHILSIGSYIIGALSFVIPEFSLKTRVISCLFFFLLPLIVPISIWFIKAILISYNRINYYPKVIHKLKEVGVNALQYRKNSSNILLNLLSQNIFEISEAQLRNKGVCIKLESKREFVIYEKDDFLVVDKKDEIIIGTFQVTSVFDNHFYANSSDCDPIWKGYIHENPNSLYPNLYAFFVPQRRKE